MKTENFIKVIEIILAIGLITCLLVSTYLVYKLK